MTSPAALGRLASTQVHIQMIPSPRKIGETRQILAALQKFGEVTTFRNLKYDLSNKSTNKHRPIVAIFESPDAAQRAIASSPMTVTLDSTSTSQSSDPKTSSPTKQYKTHDPIFDDVATGTIKCIIEPSRHKHENAIRRNHYFSTFYPDTEDPIYKDMNSPQTGVPLKALGDVLLSRKGKVDSYTPLKVHGTKSALGTGSIMDIWRERGIEEEGGPPKSDKEGVHRV
ncbi:uncharacterized protein N7484_010066 [Penicillium longicatenatum]|uniref:uncharacterized protein n=1 Tax=Penicillium longicatenatum TaxID=1561947 RepID=UPI00254932CE|nr:uncharacterized protein N7484_010066 [Penicillium longicatenatum]KAJ5636753.1 hypothetical protein N7484_010066 [Penicillium longicatenatum]